MENELVDILMTTYNSNTKFLIKQIDSILNQTYKKIKLYISDDFSTNLDVKEILLNYEKKDNRIKVFMQQSNIGVNKNFEFLLKKSTANYIMFCDHDDIWHKDKVEKLLENITKNNVDLVYSDATQIDENDKCISDSYLKSKHFPIIEGKNIKKVISRHTIIGCSQMITKDVKEKMLPFNKNVIAHDWLSVFIASTLKGIKYIDNQLLDYRLHSSNIFGGRNTEQNISNWKNLNDSSYKSFLKYRNDVISRGYEKGTLMCLGYIKDENMKKYTKELLNYFDSLKKSSYINFKIHNYFKFMWNRGLGIRAIKETVLFHLPILGYVVFKRK